MFLRPRERVRNAAMPARVQLRGSAQQEARGSLDPKRAEQRDEKTANSAPKPDPRSKSAPQRGRKLTRARSTRFGRGRARPSATKRPILPDQPEQKRSTPGARGDPARPRATNAGTAGGFRANPAPCAAGCRAASRFREEVAPRPVAQARETRPKPNTAAAPEAGPQPAAAALGCRKRAPPNVEAAR